MQILIAASAGLVAVMYVFLGVGVAPRLARLAPTDRWATVAKYSAGAFLLGCAATHVGIAAQALAEGGVDGHPAFVLLPYLAQVAGGGLFIYVVMYRLDLQVQTRTQAEIQQLREELVRNDRLQSLGQLAGSVAHDFNNLLAVILSFGQFVRSEVEDDAVAEDIDQIIQAAERGAELTQQLLHFSRRQAAERTVVDVNAELRRLEPFLKQVVGRDVELDLRLGEDVPLVELGAGQLDQIVVNLAANARDAMPDGGTFRVQTERVEGRTARVTVSDDGVGMPDEVVEQAFEPFFTTKEPGKGTGFGLATVHGIVRRAHGSAAIESAPGRGTTFRIDLPASEQAAVAAPRAVRARPDREIRVLLVEDEHDVRRGLERMLEAHVRVLSVPDGAMALETLGRNPVDVVVTDLSMPGMTGEQLVERVRARWPDVGIVCMSGSIAIAPEGAVRLTKPFSREDLLEAVAAADGARPGSPGSPGGPRPASGTGHSGATPGS